MIAQMAVIGSKARRLWPRSLGVRGCFGASLLIIIRSWTKPYKPKGFIGFRALVFRFGIWRLADLELWGCRRSRV